MNKSSSCILLNLVRTVFIILVLYFDQNNFAAQDQNISDQYIQEFHKGLSRVDPQWFQKGIQTYYKKMDPITSTPDSEVNRWSFSIIIAGQKISPGQDGFYRIKDRKYGDISLKINHYSTDFNLTQDLMISVMHNGIFTNLECFKRNEKKELVLPGFKSYDELLSKMRDNKLWWIHEVIFEGDLPVSDNEPCAISIESMNVQKNPLTVRGMAITYRKDQEKTKIFFDFADSANRSVGYYSPISCKHKKKLGTDKKLFRVHQHRLYECNAKDIATYEFFDSLDNRNKWMPQETGFYDQNQHALISLPSGYCDANDHPETPTEPLTWIFEEGLDSFYEFDGAQILMDTNDYLYSAGDGSLFATLRYQAIFKEYLSEQNGINVRYLEQVAKPSLSVSGDAAIAGGHYAWDKGVYQKIRFGDRTSWQKIEAQRDHTFDGKQGNEIVQFHNEVPCQPELNGAAFSLKWPAPQEEFTARQSKRWCDAAQSFFLTFEAKISRCDRDVLNGFAIWNKLTSLNLSNLRLENGIVWSDVLKGVGLMKQLRSLNFSNNSPIIDFDENYTQLADRALTYYIALGACLGDLENLEDLHLQGLWLKSHGALAGGVEPSGRLSKQVAILTGIINHKDSIGISAIIKNICELKRLKKLSLDGIPNHGTSQSDLIPWWMVTSLVNIRQSQALQTLATVSADSLAEIPSLSAMRVYSPGGNCSDHFSNFFKERITHSRPATLSALTVHSAILRDSLAGKSGR